MRRTLLGKCLILMMLITVLFHHDVQAERIKKNEVAGGIYTNGMNPGMALRLEQKTINAFKNTMQGFLPHYLNVDAKLPPSASYNLKTMWGLINYTFEWTDVTYDTGEFDFMDIQIDLMSSYSTPMIMMDFPTLKEWKMHANQKVDSALIKDSQITMEFKNFELQMNCIFQCTEFGHLHPHVYHATVSVGETFLYHDNKIVEFFMYQVVELALMIIQNTIYFSGNYILTNMGTPVLTKFLNNMILPLPQTRSPFHGQDSIAYFEFDYRQTEDPYIGQEGDKQWIDSYFLGALMWQTDGKGCAFEHDAFDFMNATTFSQLVVTETALTCALNNIAKTPIGRLDFTEQKINKFFEVDDVRLDTTSFSKHMPIFLQKIGPKKQMKINVSYKGIYAMLGQYDVDTIIEYTLCISFQLDDANSTELIYDELKMVTSFNMKLENDVAFIEIVNNKLDLSKNRVKSAPVRNSMKMTKNEYREFLSTLGFNMNFMKKWMNDVTLRGGVNMPFTMNEIYTTVDFQPKSAHIFMEVEEKADIALERNFWDAASAPK